MTNDHKAGAAAECNGSGPVDPGSQAGAAHHDAAFYHESAAFHHRQAAHHLEHGRAADAERHIWAAFGHSLNAHESTRAGVSAMRESGRSSGRTDGSPMPGVPPVRHDHN